MKGLLIDDNDHLMSASPAVSDIPVVSINSQQIDHFRQPKSFTTIFVSEFILFRQVALASHIFHYSFSAVADVTTEANFSRHPSAFVRGINNQFTICDDKMILTMVS